MIRIQTTASRRSVGTAQVVDLSTLPATHTVKGTRAAGIFLIVFALLWGGLPTLGLLVAILSGNFEPAMLFMLIFSLVGLAMLLAGLNMTTTRKTIHFDEQSVTMDAHSLFGTTHWKELLRNFPGVRSRSEYHSGGKNQSSYTLYIVELYHPDKKKRIRLYESRSDSGFRKTWETYCRQLHLPALEGEGDTMTSRDVEDLDKSVRELAREGKLEVTFDPSAPPPEGITLQIEDGHLLIGLPRARFSIIGWLFGLLFPAVFISIGFGVSDAPVVFGIVGIVILVGVVAAMVWYLVARGVVRVGPDQVRLSYRTPWGETAGRALASDQIETVRIGRAVERQGQVGVVMVTDETTLTAGPGLPPASLEWLKSCILAVITR